MLLFISLCLLIRQIQLGQESDSVCDIFFLCSFNVRLNVVVSTVYKKKHCKIKIFICAFIFKCLGESFMALWAVYHLLYPENNLELIPNIVCMFVLGVY